MRKIEKYYLNQVISYWVITSTILVGIQSLFAAIRDYQKISSQYTLDLYFSYLGNEALYLFVDLAPITIFLSIVITHSQWAQKSLWLSAALSGQTQGSWMRVMFYHISFCCLILVSLRYLILPHISYDLSSQRLIALGRLNPEQHFEKICSQGRQFFYTTSQGELASFDLEKQQIVLNEEESSKKNYEHVMALKRDIKIGLSSSDLAKKMAYKKEASGNDKKILSSALLKDALYPFLIIAAVLCGWRDNPVQWNNRQYRSSPIKMTLSLVALYFCLKVLPLATFFFKTSYVFWAAGLTLLSVIALPPENMVRSV